MATLSKEEIVESIEEMTVLELSELVEEIEDRFDVEAGAMAGAVAAAPAGDQEEEEEEESSVVDVVMTDFGDSKIQVIKEVRSVSDLGLKEAKKLVEDPPSSIKEGLAREDAEEVQEDLEAAGATVELQ